MGGALQEPVSRAPQTGYVDTPVKRAVREIHQDWQPIFGIQETPPFAEMRTAAFEQDDSTFDDTEIEYAMPDIAPTGLGGLHPTEDRETSHFMGNLLESINPELKTLYFGGAPNVHLDRVANHLHDEFYTTDPLGRVTTANRRYTFNRSLPGPGVWGPERVGNPTEFHGR